MTKSEALIRLFDAYDKPIKPGRMYYYEEWAKNLSAEMVSKIIDMAVKQNDYLPTVNKLHSLVSLEDITSTSIQKNVYYCYTCKGGFTAADGICPVCGEKGA